MKMLKCASVYTYEVDDLDVALDEINTQLSESITLLEHTVGVIMCHPEFVASGAVKHISENLPFDMAGITSSAQAVNGEIGELMLTIFIMTSDDAWFKTGATADLTDEIYAPTQAAYAKASDGESGAPKLALIFPPLFQETAGDDYIEAWERIIPGVPVFGGLAIEDTIPFDDSETIHNGESFKTAMTFILCYGNIDPRFYIGTLHEDRVMPYKGEITKSSGSVVQEINNIPAYDYFEDLGFASNGMLVNSFGFVLFVIDQKKRDDYDGVPVVRGIASFTEDGAAVFRGDMDEGSTFNMLISNSDDVMSTTETILSKVNEIPDINGVILMPCIIRRIVAMSIGPLSELDAIASAIKPGIPYMAGYAGGEICPSSIKNSIPTNRFHNYSLVVLVI